MSDRSREYKEAQQGKILFGVSFLLPMVVVSEAYLWFNGIGGLDQDKPFIFLGMAQSSAVMPYIIIVGLLLFLAASVKPAIWVLKAGPSFIWYGLMILSLIGAGCGYSFSASYIDGISKRAAQKEYQELRREDAREIREKL